MKYESLIKPLEISKTLSKDPEVVEAAISKYSVSVRFENIDIEFPKIRAHLADRREWVGFHKQSE